MMSPNCVTRTLGLLVAGIGLSGLAAWHSGFIFLAGILPGTPPISYISSFSFFCCGLGLAIYHNRWLSITALLCGALVAVGGLIWGLDWMFGRSSGQNFIDGMLPVVADHSHRRPSPASPLSFFFFGLAIVCLALPIRRPLQRVAIWVLGALALAPYLAVVGGYVSGFLSMSDGATVYGMAPHTILAFMLLGVGLLSTQLSDRQSLRNDPWLPLPVFLVTASASVIYWLGLTLERDDAFRRIAAEAARNVASNCLLLINGPIRSLEHMKARWEFAGGTPFDQWKHDAETYIGSEQVFAAIEWADLSGKIIWCLPESQAKKTLGFQIREDKRWDASALLDDALARRAIAISPTGPLRQAGANIGGRQHVQRLGFIVYLPLFKSGRFDGWLIGAIRIDNLMKAAISAATIEGQAVTIYEDDRLILGPGTRNAENLGEAKVTFGGRQWRFVVEPNKIQIPTRKLPTVTLILGLLLAVTSAMVVWTLQKIYRANLLLARYANEDYLTGLLNRRAFDDVLKNEFRRARRARKPLSVLMADVDFFKKYNDRYGHQAGDECLRRVASQFQAAVRRAGDAVGRYGGEEFCGLLPETDLEGAHVFAEHIRASIEAMQLPHELNPNGCVTASFGVASIDFLASSVENEETLLSKADQALYEAKGAGRNQVR